MRRHLGTARGVRAQDGRPDSRFSGVFALALPCVPTARVPRARRVVLSCVVCAACLAPAARSLVGAVFGGLCVGAQGDLTTYNIRRLFANVGEGTSVCACRVACHGGKGARDKDDKARGKGLTRRWAPGNRSPGDAGYKPEPELELELEKQVSTAPALPQHAAPSAQCAPAPQPLPTCQLRASCVPAACQLGGSGSGVTDKRGWWLAHRRSWRGASAGRGETTTTTPKALSSVSGATSRGLAAASACPLALRASGCPLGPSPAAAQHPSPGLCSGSRGLLPRTRTAADAAPGALCVCRTRLPARLGLLLPPLAVRCASYLINRDDI